MKTQKVRWKRLGVVYRGSLIQFQVDGLRVRDLSHESFSDGLVGTVLLARGTRYSMIYRRLLNVVTKPLTPDPPLALE